jgi:hypothetical protein
LEETQTLERLKEELVSEEFDFSITDKSFRGIIKDNTFRIISSELEKAHFVFNRRN